MRKIRKVYNVKIIAVIIASVFLCNDALYSFPVSRDLLRVPLGGYKDIGEIQQKSRLDRYIQVLNSRLHKKTIPSLISNFFPEHKILLKALNNREDPYGKLRESVSLKLLQERTEKILRRKVYNKNTLKEDMETIGLLYFYFKDFFVHNFYFVDAIDGMSTEAQRMYCSTKNVELTRDFLVRLVRSFFNPFFERQGFFIVDFFAGTEGLEKLPPRLPIEELRKIGCTEDDDLYIYMA
jgi:hypothetical protein